MELKNTVTELKSLIDGFDSRLDQAEQSEREDRSFEINHLEEQKGNCKRVIEACGSYEKLLRQLVLCHWSPSRRREGKGSRKHI